MDPVSKAGTRRAVQRRLESYTSVLGLPGDLVTITRDFPGSKAHRIESPASTPNTSTTVDGTVVRRDADRSIALTSFDSIGFGTETSIAHPAGIKESVGLHVRQHVGSNLKYSRAVGQHVGRQMIDLPPRLPAREERAAEMLEVGVRVGETSTPGEFIVPSQSGGGFYRVTGVGIPGGFEACQCEDFNERFAPCKHILLVRLWIKDSHLDSEAEQDRESARKPRVRPPFYSEAQQEEGRLFPILLRELAKGVTEPEREPHLAGRPPIPLRDQAFCAIQKIYTGKSARVSHSNRVTAAAEGKIEATPYWDVISKFLCRPETTPILEDMLARSALPLRSIETRCAIDSTGFRTTKFHHYREEKYNPTRKNVWLKAHALVGIRTHAVLAVDISEGTAGDSPRFPILLERAMRAGFQLKEVLADRAYNSRQNFTVAEDLGLTALIPFKSNQTGQSKGSPEDHKIFLFFTYHRDKFDEHYRDRVNVEITFGSIKQKIGETIMSRNFNAQVNELLCKLVAHNITMLIQAMYGIGVLPEFLQPRGPPQSETIAMGPGPLGAELSFNRSDSVAPVVLSDSSR
jgi:transposase